MAQHIPIQSVEGKRYREIEKSIWNNPPSRSSVKWNYIQTYMENNELVDRYQRVRPVKVNKKDFGLEEIDVEVIMRTKKNPYALDKNIIGMYFVA